MSLNGGQGTGCVPLGSGIALPSPNRMQKPDTVGSVVRGLLIMSTEDEYCFK